MKSMKKLLMIATIALSSCYTSNKAERDLNKANEFYPEKVAEFARLKFPCKETSIDSITKTEYDFIEIKCPDQPEPKTTIDTLYINKPTKPKTYIITKDKFVALPSTIKVITKLIKDSSCEILLKKSETDVQYYVHKSEKQSEWIKWLLVLLGISFIINLLFVTNKR